ncbi:hypothetical protein GJAV_G00085060 [Gymnothorax javanicus]|nr:hypothetical protein GJAV_G00085060 [Gymnothorax javanicus]
MTHFDDECFATEMEDRESLKRQIALLQNLIDSHKSVHGDVPSRSSQWECPLLMPTSGRGQGTSFRARTRSFASNPVGHWRKKYSLSNQRNAHPPSSTTTALPSKHNDSFSTHLSTGMATPSLGLPPQACGSALASHSRLSPYPAPGTQKAVPSLAPGTPNTGPSLAPGTQKAGFSLASGTQKTGPSLAPGTLKAGSSQALGTHKVGPSLAPWTPKTGPSPAPGTQKAGPSLALGAHKVGPASAPRTPKTGPSPAPGTQKAGPSLALGAHKVGPASAPRTPKTGPSPALGTQKTDPSQAPGTGLSPVPGRRAVSASRMSQAKWCGRGTGAPASSGSMVPPEGAGRGQAGQVTPVSLALAHRPQSVGDQEVGGASVSHRKSLGLPGETGSALQLKPHLQKKMDSAPKLAALISNPLPDAPPLPPPAAFARTIITAKGGGVKQRPLPSQGKSRFSWVKGSQGLSPNPTPFPGCTSATPPALPGPIKKSLRQPGGVAKTSKYTWVSSSSARLPRKPLSPKAVDTPHRTAAGGGTKKGKSPASLAAKHKKCAGSAGSSHSHAHSSRYRWKAVGQNRTDVVRGGSVYRWTSEKENGPKGRSDPGTSPSRARSSPASIHAPSPSPSPSPGGFRLRSPMKIIRRRSSNSIAAVCPERRSSPSAVLTLRSRYALRRRAASVPARSPACSRKVPARGLVSISRHKLRRLSPTPSSTSSGSRTASSSSPRYTVGQRVIKTRYKIITRRPGTGPAHNTTQSSALTWRAKRLQSARALLQSRLRTAQPWRGRDMRWIGGTLYRVSANKLCRTGSTSSASAGSASSPRQRAGKPWGAQDGVGRPLCGWDPSRAVQRSLAIVRQAKQRKQQQGRQYCMYYNRFGKCNRGQACPYIHDPDKVAVCTRFLRGTCKQTDGSCPFSHKVSKEKMPVCSYFLRGICSNSSCPYSHVYVSRSAGVCQDFVRGYCPKGEKCKQKHTLVCPDFSSTGSCPRGSKCKLQHRQRLKRTKPDQASAPPKRARTQEAPPRSDGAEPLREDPAPPGPSKLPSFISLLSSPEPTEEEEASNSSTAPGSEVTERKLQIKPRF